MREPMIKIENVSLKFNVDRNRANTLKEYVVRFLKRDLKYGEFWALRGISGRTG